MSSRHGGVVGVKYVIKIYLREKGLEASRVKCEEEMSKKGATIPRRGKVGYVRRQLIKFIRANSSPSVTAPIG
ncbi:hypothetical protein HPP92_004801 [Vanilla planifolia]|uniref:Uncharacterized protein n=1 Tax=Vanilla planifolia TaxID=51239 RepID=A0A835VCL7_VANPL|nr:hypothetical protein HPP92_004801 [Vanilla planifolia]